MTVWPVASAIWLASVRCQISRYSASSWPLSSPATCCGERNGVVGRIASCASCAFFTLRRVAARRRATGTAAPYSLVIAARTACSASSERTTASVRM